MTAGRRPSHRHGQQACALGMPVVVKVTLAKVPRASGSRCPSGRCCHHLSAASRASWLRWAGPEAAAFWDRPQLWQETAALGVGAGTRAHGCLPCRGGPPRKTRHRALRLPDAPPLRELNHRRLLGSVCPVPPPCPALHTRHRRPPSPPHSRVCPPPCAGASPSLSAQSGCARSKANGQTDRSSGGCHVSARSPIPPTGLMSSPRLGWL